MAAAARMKIETDEVEITAGIRGGRTLGSPIGITVRNRDFAKLAGCDGCVGITGGSEARGHSAPARACGSCRRVEVSEHDFATFSNERARAKP